MNCFIHNYFTVILYNIYKYEQFLATYHILILILMMNLLEDIPNLLLRHNLHHDNLNKNKRKKSKTYLPLIPVSIRAHSQ